MARISYTVDWARGGRGEGPPRGRGVARASGGGRDRLGSARAGADRAPARAANSLVCDPCLMLRDLDVAAVAHQVGAHLVQHALHVFERERQRAVILWLVVAVVVLPSSQLCGVSARGVMVCTIRPRFRA